MTKKPIVNDNGVEREMNEEEYAGWLITCEAEKAEKAVIEEKEKTRLALFEKLGLTKDEAILLLQ